MTPGFETDCVNQLKNLLDIASVLALVVVLKCIITIGGSKLRIAWQDGMYLEVVGEMVSFGLATGFGICSLLFYSGGMPIEGIDYGPGAASPIEQICTDK